MKVCSCCKLEKPIELYRKEYSRKDGLSRYCNPCFAEKMRQYRKQKPDMFKQIELNRRQTSRYKQRRSAKRAKRQEASVKWRNDFFIDEAYSLAKLREKVTGIKWEVDHIVPLNSKIACGLHVETNLQVIPKVLNLIKGARNTNQYHWSDFFNANPTNH